jgi:RNA polymerase sigma factor (sigma-70 family)
MKGEVPEAEMADEDREQLRDKIRQAIRILKRPQRRCFCLFYIQQKSYQEIAEITGYSYDAVRSHIQNGRRKFKLIMKRWGVRPYKYLSPNPQMM